MLKYGFFQLGINYLRVGLLIAFVAEGLFFNQRLNTLKISAAERRLNKLSSVVYAYRIKYYTLTDVVHTYF